MARLGAAKYANTMDGGCCSCACDEERAWEEHKSHFSTSLAWRHNYPIPPFASKAPVHTLNSSWRFHRGASSCRQGHRRSGRLVGCRQPATIVPVGPMNPARRPSNTPLVAERCTPAACLSLVRRSPSHAGGCARCPCEPYEARRLAPACPLLGQIEHAEDFARAMCH